MGSAATPTFRRIESIHHVEAGHWNGLLAHTAPGYPFLRHEFLAALEDSHSVAPATGWQPAHVLTERGGTLTAAAPLYYKQHSFGEFVFDFAWADACRRAGLDYYPKLVCAAPFNPVVGPRLLASDATAHRQLAAHLCGLPEATGVSSVHMLFGHAEDRHAVNRSGALVRRDCQYRWYNRGYDDFEDFLARLSSKRRKEVRRERRRVQAAGIEVRVLTPAQIDAGLWQAILGYYARTYLVRGQHPYLYPEFFFELADTMPDRVRFFVAFGGNGPLAMAFMLVGDDTLYGRHWGCAEDMDGLHFETCYYAGIEYCIRHGLRCFDAGVQGEHKLHRGFEPIATWSAHVLREPRLHRAVADFVRREAGMMAELHHEQRARCAFPEAAEHAP